MVSSTVIIALILTYVIQQTSVDAFPVVPSENSKEPIGGQASEWQPLIYFQDNPSPRMNCSAALTNITPPLIAMGATWLFFILVAVVIWIVSSTLASGLETVYDGSNASTATHFYMVKVRVGKLPKDFYGLAKKKAVITMDLNDKDNFVSRLSIPVETNPEKLGIMAKESRVIKFKVARLAPFGEVTSIRFDHDCFREEVMVYGVEIKDIKEETKIWKCKVNNKIKALGPVGAFSEQVFNVKRRRAIGETQEDSLMKTTETGNKEHSADPVIDTEPTTTLTCMEIWLALWVGTNVVACWMTAINVQADICDIVDTNAAIFKGMIAGGVTVVGMTIVMALYSCIKQRAVAEQGVFSCLKWCVVLVLVLMGAVFGGISVYIASQLPNIRPLLYGSAAGISLLAVFAFLIWGLVGCWTRRFRKNTFDIREADKEAERNADAKRRLAEEEARRRVEQAAKSEVQSQTEYINTVRIKSLEQQQKRTEPSPPAPPPPKVTSKMSKEKSATGGKKVASQVDSVVSSGASYLNQVMATGAVKSITEAPPNKK